MRPARNWRLQPVGVTFAGEQCECGAKIFPPRDLCPNCGDPVLEGKNVSEVIREGKAPPPRISYGGKEREV